MNRRKFLTYSGAVSAVGGGAYWYLSQGGEDDDGPSGNGNTSKRTATPFPVGTADPNETPSNTPTPAGEQTPTSTPYPESVDSSTFNLSWVVDVSGESITVEMNSEHITNSYPEGANLVLAAIGEDESSQSASFVGEKEVSVPTSGVSRETVTLQTQDLSRQKPYYFFAVLFDSRTQDGSNTTSVAMSDSYDFDGDGFTRNKHRAYVGSTNTDNPDASYIRYDLPGRYVVVIQGSTAGHPWRLTLPFFKRTFNRRAHVEGDIQDFNEAIQSSFTAPEGGTYSCEPLVTATREFLSQSSFSLATELVFYADIVRALENAPEYRSGISEYTQYPVETLVIGGGDARDVSLLLSGMALKAGVGAALILPEFEEGRHMGVGVSGEFSGFSLELNGTDYYYLEPTNHGSGGIGEADAELKDRSYQFLEFDRF